MKPDVICPHCQKGMLLDASLLRTLWARYTNGLRKTRGGGRPRKLAILNAVPDLDQDSETKPWDSERAA